MGSRRRRLGSCPLLPVLTLSLVTLSRNPQVHGIVTLVAFMIHFLSGNRGARFMQASLSLSLSLSPSLPLSITLALALSLSPSLSLSLSLSLSHTANPITFNVLRESNHFEFKAVRAVLMQAPSPGPLEVVVRFGGGHAVRVPPLPDG